MCIRDRLVPERFIATMHWRAALVVHLAIHRTESRALETTQRPRMRFAVIEKGMAQATPAIRCKQHGFTAVEHRLHCKPRTEERLLE